MSPQADVRPAALDVLARTGSPVTLTLTFPAAYLDGRTFTASVGGTAITPAVVGDVMTLSVTGAQTTTLGNGRHAILLTDTTGDDAVRISGRLLLGSTATDSPDTSVTILTDTNVSVDVSVVTAGVDLATVQGLIDDLVAGAPGALDTLNELAAALGDDAAFATTVTNALAATASTADLTTEASDRASADAALDSRLDAIEVLGSLATDAEVTAAIASEVTRADGAYDAFGAAAAAQAASQPADADLSTIAALDSATAGALVTDGAGWIRKTYAQLKTALGLVKGDVGLGNVDNTSDANKPVSTATQTALDLKAALASPTFTGVPVSPAWSTSGLTGATTATRYVGGTTGGPPSSGTFVAGDFVVTTNGAVWVCTVGGTPGTWVSAAWPYFARKTSDETVTSSNLLQDDNELLVTLPSAGVFEFFAFLIYDGSTTGDFKTAFTVPAGASLSWSQVALGPTVGSSGGNLADATVVVGSGVTSGSGKGAAGAGVKVAVWMHGVVVMGGTAGPLALQWAQVASDPTATTVFANSYMKARRMS